MPPEQSEMPFFIQIMSYLHVDSNFRFWVSERARPKDEGVCLKTRIAFQFLKRPGAFSGAAIKTLELSVHLSRNPIGHDLLLKIVVFVIFDVLSIEHKK